MNLFEIFFEYYTSSFYFLIYYYLIKLNGELFTKLKNLVSVGGFGGNSRKTSMNSILLNLRTTGLNFAKILFFNGKAHLYYDYFLKKFKKCLFLKNKNNKNIQLIAESNA